MEKSFLNNTEEYRKLKIIEVRKGYSLNVVETFEDNSIDFVFIDGLHDFDNVYLDIKNWYEKVKSGGIVSGHDVHNPYFGVKQALEKFASENNILYSIDGPIFWFYKK